jgi:hypothetical protein
MKPLVHFAALLTMFLLLTGSTSAQATTFSLDDCASCAGSDVSLAITTSDGGATYDVVLTLDSTDYTGSQDSIVQAGFKAFDGLTADDILAFSFSDGTWSDPELAGISADGFCSGGGDPGFVCSTGEANIVNDPGVYTFTYKIDGSNVTLLSNWSIKFQYCDSADYDGGSGDCNGHIISEDGSAGGPPVPEPSAALVFAVGLLVARRKLRARR